MKKYILSLVVQNNFGVLARISSLFARRGYNIDSISASPTNEPKITKITVVVEADDEIIEKVFKQVSKLEEVEKVTQIDEKQAICKELALLKIHTENTATSAEISNTISEFQGKILEIQQDSVTVELSDIPSNVDNFVSALSQFDILEMCRTGVTAL